MNELSGYAPPLQDAEVCPATAATCQRPCPRGAEPGASDLAAGWNLTCRTAARGRSTCSPGACRRRTNSSSGDSRLVADARVHHSRSKERTEHPCRCGTHASRRQALQMSQGPCGSGAEQCVWPLHSAPTRCWLPGLNVTGCGLKRRDMAAPALLLGLRGQGGMGG
jgi:hypothetical protein